MNAEMHRRGLLAFPLASASLLARHFSGSGSGSGVGLAGRG